MLTRSQFTWKLSRGDAVVSFDKLPFLQKAHFRRLVLADPPDIEFVRKHILGPMEIAIRRLEDARQASLSPSEPEASLGGLNVDLTTLDRIVPHLCFDNSYDGSISSQNYIHRALQISPQLPNDLSYESWVKDNSYLFWGLPPPLLESRLKEIMDRPCLIWIKDEVSSLAAAMDFILDKISSITTEDWGPRNLTEAAKSIGDRIRFEERNGGGWKFLRWALLAGNNGPSVALVMELLGREETMRRLELAKEVVAREGWAKEKVTGNA
jgi:glutamyl-tRNA synthetase